MKFEWLKNTNWQEKLDGDYRIIADLCGIDNLIKLLETFQKTEVYFSLSPFEEMIMKYMMENPTMKPKEVARETGVSIKYIYSLMSKKPQKKKNNLS